MNRFEKKFKKRRANFLSLSSLYVQRKHYTLKKSTVAENHSTPPVIESQYFSKEIFW